MTEVKPNKKIREDLDMLQSEFRDILILSRKSFELHPVPLDDVRLWVASLCVDQQENIPMFDESKRVEINKSSYNELFLLLTDHEVWDALNIRELKKMVKHFAPNDEKINERIARYASKVDKFKQDTNLREYLRVRASKTNKTLNYGSFQAKLEARKDFHNFTLADVAEHEGFLADQFLLNQFIFRLQESRRGCIQITWLVPSSVIPLLKPERLAEKRESLKERGILEIRVDNRYIYMVCHHLYTFILHSLDCQ